MTAGTGESSSPLGIPTWQGGDLETGETFVADRRPVMAQLLLAATDELGRDPIDVRAVTSGFIVPDAVWEHAQTIRADREGWDF